MSFCIPGYSSVFSLDPNVIGHIYYFDETFEEAPWRPIGTGTIVTATDLTHSEKSYVISTVSNIFRKTAQRYLFSGESGIFISFFYDPSHTPADRISIVIPIATNELWDKIFEAHKKALVAV